MNVASVRQTEASARSTATLRSSKSAQCVWDHISRRLITCNNKFREFYPSVELKPGLEFEDLVRFTAKHAVFLVGKHDIDTWVEGWMGCFGKASRNTYRTADERWIEVITSPTDTGEMLLTYADVTSARTAVLAERTRAEREANQEANLELLRSAVAIGRESTIFHKAARKMLTLVGAWGEWNAGTIYLIGSSGGEDLHSTGVWFRSDEGFLSVESQREIDALCQEPDDVLQQVVSSRMPVWIGNLSVDPRVSEARRLALGSVRTLCAVPVMSENQVVAVVEFLAKEAMTPDGTRERLMFDAIGQLAHAFTNERVVHLDKFPTDHDR